MKKAVIIIAATALLFTSCNADATSGLFRTATEAREALTIKYMQVVGRKGANDTLCFLTKEGLFVKDTNAAASGSIVESAEGSRVQGAAYLNDVNKLLYKTDKDGGSLFKYDPATDTKTPIQFPPLRSPTSGSCPTGRSC